MRYLFISIFMVCALLVKISWAEFPFISAEELKGMLEKGQKVLVVDVRTKAEYRQGHLPKAINVAPEQYSFIEKFLPKDKKKLIVFYCRGWG